jgi:hypothetical protein
MAWLWKTRGNKIGREGCGDRREGGPRAMTGYCRRGSVSPARAFVVPLLQYLAIHGLGMEFEDVLPNVESETQLQFHTRVFRLLCFKSGVGRCVHASSHSILARCIFRLLIEDICSTGLFHHHHLSHSFTSPTPNPQTSPSNASSAPRHPQATAPR